MKSPPGRSVVRTSTSAGGSVSRGGVGAVAASATRLCAAAGAAAGGTSAAAPVAAALFRKPRRSSDPLFDIGLILPPVGADLMASSWPVQGGCRGVRRALTMLSSTLGRLLRVVFEEVDDLPPMSPIVARGW